MISNMNMVRKNEDGVNTDVKRVFWLNFSVILVLVGLMVTLGICIAWMNETVHKCQFKNKYPDKELPSWMTVKLHNINTWFWVLFAAFGSITVVFSTYVVMTSKSEDKA